MLEDIESKKEGVAEGWDHAVVGRRFEGEEVDTRGGLGAGYAA